MVFFVPTRNVERSHTLHVTRHTSHVTSRMPPVARRKIRYRTRYL